MSRRWQKLLSLLCAMMIICDIPVTAWSDGTDFETQIPAETVSVEIAAEETRTEN